MKAADEEFNAFLEKQIDRVVALRPAEPYKELMLLLYQRLPPEMRKLNSRIDLFGRSFAENSQL